MFGSQIVGVSVDRLKCNLVTCFGLQIVAYVYVDSKKKKSIK